MKEVDVVYKHKPVDNCQLPHILGEMNFNIFFQTDSLCPSTGVE